MQECGDFRHGQKCCWIPPRGKIRRFMVGWPDVTVSVDFLRRN
jgi:hypothetical protein